MVSKTEPTISEDGRLKKKIAKIPPIMTIDARCLKVPIPGGSVNIKIKFATKAVAQRIIKIQKEGSRLKISS